MEPRGRRRHRTRGAGKDRLVVGAVPWVAAARTLDIGRERHRAVTHERLPKCPGSEVEAQGHVTLRMLLGDVGGETLGENEAVARSPPARTFGKSPPRSAAEIAVERGLERRPPAVTNE